MKVNKIPPVLSLTSNRDLIKYCSTCKYYNRTTILVNGFCIRCYQQSLPKKKDVQ